MDSLIAKILGVVVIVGLFITVIFLQLAPTVSDIGEDVDTNLTNTSVTDWSGTGTGN
jgi:hypothetical protein